MHRMTPTHSQQETLCNQQPEWATKGVPSQSPQIRHFDFNLVTLSREHSQVCWASDLQKLWDKFVLLKASTFIVIFYGRSRTIQSSSIYMTHARVDVYTGRGKNAAKYKGTGLYSEADINTVSWIEGTDQHSVLWTWGQKYYAGKTLGNYLSRKFQEHSLVKVHLLMDGRRKLYPLFLEKSNTLILWHLEGLLLLQGVFSGSIGGKAYPADLSSHGEFPSPISSSPVSFLFLLSVLWYFTSA